MKLSTIQIKSILENTSSFSDEDILCLLHDELDFDLLMPLLYTLIKKGRFGDESVTPKSVVDSEMLEEIFRRFPKLFVWMFINREDKLKEYLSSFASYSDLGLYMATGWAQNSKIDDHLKQYMAELFGSLINPPRIKPIIFTGNDEAFKVVQKMMPDGVKEIVIGNQQYGMLKTSVDYPMDKASDIVAFMKDILPHPVIMLETTKHARHAYLGLGRYESVPEGEENERLQVNELVKFSIRLADTSALRGLSSDLPTKYLNRVSSVSIQCTLSQDIDSPKYYLTLGHDVDVSFERFTKGSTKTSVQKHIFDAVNKYLRAEVSFMFHDVEQIDTKINVWRRFMNNGYETRFVKTLVFPQYRIEKLNGELVHLGKIKGR